MTCKTVGRDVKIIVFNICKIIDRKSLSWRVKPLVETQKSLFFNVYKIIDRKSLSWCGKSLVEMYRSLFIVYIKSLTRSIIMNIIRECNFINSLPHRPMWPMLDTSHYLADQCDPCWTRPTTSQTNMTHTGHVPLPPRRQMWVMLDTSHYLADQCDPHWTRPTTSQTNAGHAGHVSLPHRPMWPTKIIASNDYWNHC